MRETALITAIFASPVAASRAVDALETAGFGRDRITVLMADRVRQDVTRPIDLAAEPAASEPGRSATTGAIVGGSMAALAAAAVSLTGLGIFAVGPLAALLGGGTLGAAAGGLLGSLIGLGVKGDVARVYERNLQDGAVLVGVGAEPTVAAAAERVLRRAGGRDFARIDRVA